jgi:CHAT domain-containing protein/tetratricopeptide (TPR) repeat protein
MFSKIWKNFSGKSNDDIREQVLQRIARSVQLRQQGRYKQAIQLATHAISLARQQVGNMHPDVASCLNNLALIYDSMGNYVEAEQLYQQALGIFENTLGKQNPHFAACLNNLADLYRLMSNYSGAELLHKQAIEITRIESGERSREFAASLNNFGLLYKHMGNYAAAEPLYRQALEATRATFGRQHPHVAISLNNLAILYCLMSNYAAAEQHLKQAQEIISTDKKNPVHANILNSLAVVYYWMDKPAAAEVCWEEALQIYKTTAGKLHPLFASALNNLAGLYISRLDYSAAESLLQQAVDIKHTLLGEEHPSYAVSLNGLAMLYKTFGNYAAAEPLYQRALEILSEKVGEQHPDFITVLSNLADLYTATDRKNEALRMKEQLMTVQEQMIGQVFSISSENQRTAYLKTIRSSFDTFLSLISQSFANNSEAVRSALSVVLRRKAIEAEALATQRDAVLGGKYPEVAPKLREITTLRAQIAQRTLAGPGKEGLQVHQQLLAEWNAQKEWLEADIARRVPETNLEQKLRSIDHQVVAMAMPVGAALIEFVRFNVFDFKAVPARKELQWKPARYLAFVILAREPETVEMIDLGKAEPIDRMIATFRDILEKIINELEEDTKGLGGLPSSVARTEVEDKWFLVENIWRELRLTVFDRLLDALGGRRRLLISPDGDLALLPFEVLPMDDGRRLIDEYHISYLGAGRDVVRFGFKSNRKPARSLVAANPDFDLAAKAIATEAGASVGRRSIDLKRDAMRFDRLPGTRHEGKNIAAMLDAELWTEGAALDARLKKCKSPRILHLATHGFFLEDQKRDPNEERLGVGAMSFGEGGMKRLTASRLENPLLRSGLALAGVNTWLEKGELMEEAEDGLLTAEDVLGLDLLDTELVVLSACNTGLGEVRVGEGVFGLRRAFVLAGAKTLVMSLWKVPDEQTRELMEDFYSRILSGEPRVDALREAQLAIKAKHPEPLYWGAFICQGDPNPLPDQLSR